MRTLFYLITLAFYCPAEQAQLSAKDWDAKFRKALSTFDLIKISLTYHFGKSLRWSKGKKR